MRPALPRMSAPGTTRYGAVAERAGGGARSRLVRESVGIEGVTPHTLRHTLASVAGDLGFPELTIRALLGHGSQTVTQD